MVIYNRKSQVLNTNLAITTNDIFAAHQLFKAHGAAGMQLLGGDADLRAQAELAAIGKAGGGVDIHCRSIHKRGELLSRCIIPGIDYEPVFSPIVSDFYSGMVVTVPLFRQQLKGGAGMDEVKGVYEKKYTGPIVVCGDKSAGGFLAGNAAAGTDRMHICVQGNMDRMLLTATYDNLGKGASGAAIQLMNLLLGANETEGLEGIV